MTELRLLVVDAHPIIEEGLENLFAEYPDLKIVATASDGQEGLQRLRQIPVDIVLTEMSLPKVDGEEVIRLFLGEMPELPILVYSGQNDESTVYRALKAGARGYVLKTSPLQELIDAIRNVHCGDYVLSPGLNPTIIEFYLEHRNRGGGPLADYATLTQREKQVFRLFADGHQTREVAELLCISPKTVAKHRVAVKRKLEINSPAEMAQYAIRIGLLDVESSQV